MSQDERTLAANLADKRTSSRVDGHVPCQVVVCIKNLSTLVTLEDLWLVVDVIAEVIDVLID